MNGLEDKTHGVRRYFYFIKEEVSSDWKNLAYHLGVSPADVNNIAGRNRDDKSCCMDLLDEWFKRNGEVATIEVLMEALSEAKLQSTVDKLKKMYPETAAQRHPVGENQAQTESIQAPDGLKAWEITNDSVKLGWTKASSNQTDGYRLEQSIAFEHRWASAQGDRKMLPATITEFTVVDLAPYNEYHFCVRSAKDRMGELILSERSVPLFVVTRKQYQPYRPRKIKLTDRTHASLSLSWKEPSPAADVKPACCEYVVEMCLHGEDKTLDSWTEYCRTTQRQCSISVQDNGVYRFRVSANNTENDVASLPEEMGDPDIPIYVKTRSGWWVEFLKTYWPFSATTQPRNQETGSIVFNISCHDLEGLRELWMNYKLGKVKTFFENLFARQARLTSVETDTELEIKIDKEDFYTCRRHLLLTRPTSKRFRLVRLGEGHFGGTQLGLSEDYPVYCKPISHKTTCSQLDFLDPAIPIDRLGVDRTISDDKLLALPLLSRHVHCSSLPGLDLAVVREDRKYRTDDISKLRADVRTGREKSQRLEVQLHVVKGQQETKIQETKALRKGVTKLTEEKEKAQKIIMVQKIEIQQLQETNKNREDRIEGMQTARQQTEATVLNLSKEVTRLTEEKEKIQNIIQEQKVEIQQLQENNKSMAATIQELMDAKHTTKGESQWQDYGRKEDSEKETDPMDTDSQKNDESRKAEKMRQSGSKDIPADSNNKGVALRSKQYVEAANDPMPKAISALGNTWQRTTELMRGRANDGAVEGYNRQMQFRQEEAERYAQEEKKIQELRNAMKEEQAKLAKERNELQHAKAMEIMKSMLQEQEALKKQMAELMTKTSEKPAEQNILSIHSKLGFKVVELRPKTGGKNIHGSSIPLILPNDLQYDASTGEVKKVQGTQRTSLQVVPEALELLEGIKEPVSVLAICGPCRTGKSYILSRLLGTADAFDLGLRMAPQTFGIWMGTKVLLGKDFTIVLLDTEGIDSVGASAGQDASILVMTILLSSQLIYNSLNVPYKSDIEKMQCFFDLTKGITVRQGETDMSAFREFFPDFLWLLRDVALKMEDDDGNEMDPTEYLVTKVLRRNPESLVKSTSDLVGRAILTFFPSVECTTLERPSGNPDVMRDITQHTNSLNPRFNNGVSELIERLLLKARSKRGYSKGSTVSGVALSIMAQQYVKAVNDPNSIPALDNTWKNTVELMRGRAIEEAVIKYIRQMQTQVAKANHDGKVPLEETAEFGRSPNQPALMDLHNELLNNVTDMLLERVGQLGISPNEKKILVDQMQKRLVQKEKRTVFYEAADGITRKQEGFDVTGGELLHYIQQNKEHSKIFCQKLSEHLLDPIRKRVKSPPTYFENNHLRRELGQAGKQYDEQACGPEKGVVLQKMAKECEQLMADFMRIKEF